MPVLLLTFCFVSCLRTWLSGLPLLVPMVLYTFLRLIPDHTRQVFDTLREREVAFCVDLLRTKVRRQYVRCVLCRDIC